MDTPGLAESTSATRRPLRRHRWASPTLNFLRHYTEMLAAMMLGMVVVGAGLGLPLSLIGIDVSTWTDAPAPMLLGMAFAMSAPMVAWMRYRGHGWAPTWEMAASMFVPSFAAIALLWSGAVGDTGSLLAIQHIAMLPSMLAVMLLRRTEYSRPARHA